MELTRALQQPESGERVWIAETSHPVGVLHLLVNRDYYQQTHAYISNLIVTEEAEGQGVGRALLAHAEAWARAEGYATLSLSVFAQNAAARAVSPGWIWRRYYPLRQAIGAERRCAGTVTGPASGPIARRSPGNRRAWRWGLD